jgi:hypothetical protein
MKPLEQLIDTYEQDQESVYNTWFAMPSANSVKIIP